LGTPLIIKTANYKNTLIIKIRLNIESSIARQVDFDSVIRNFANKNTIKSII